MMERSIFDHVARDYERIHDRSLPPGVHSADFHPPAGRQRHPVDFRRIRRQ